MSDEQTKTDRPLCPRCGRPRTRIPRPYGKAQYYKLCTRCHIEEECKIELDRGDEHESAQLREFCLDEFARLMGDKP